MADHPLKIIQFGVYTVMFSGPTRMIGLLTVQLLLAALPSVAGAQQPLRDAQCAKDAVHLSSAELMRLVVRKTSMIAPMMERTSIHGVVTLNLCVNTKGRVFSATVIGGHPMAYQSALDAVRNWRFKQYRLNGTPVNIEGDLQMEYDFRHPPQRDKQ